MQTYLVIFALSVFLSCCLGKKTRKAYFWTIIISFIPLLLYGVLRYDCNDYYDYELFHDNTFGNSAYSSVDEHYEKGYSFLNYILPEFWNVILVQTVILISSYCFAVYKFIPGRHMWMFMILFFFSGEKTIFFLTAIRNTFAAAILIFALPLIRNRKLLPFIGLTIIASLFHTSAVIFFPIAYIVGSNKPLKIVELIFWIVAIIIVLVTPLSFFTEKLNMFISGNELERYQAYLQTSHENGLLQKITSVLLSLLVLLDLFWRGNKDGTRLMLGRLSLLFFLFPLFGSLNMRATYYFVFFAILYAVYIYKGLKQPLYRTFFLCFFIAYSAYSLFVVETSNMYSNFESYKTLIDMLWM